MARQIQFITRQFVVLIALCAFPFCGFAQQSMKLCQFGSAALWFEHSVECVRFFNGSNRKIAIVGGDLFVFDIQTGRRATLVRCQKKVPLTTVGLSIDNKFAVAGDYAGSIYFCDLQKRTKVHIWKSPISPITSIFLSQDGKTVFWTDRKNIYVCDKKSGKLMRTIQPFKLRLHGVAFSPDGREVVCTGDDGALGIKRRNTRVVILDTASGKKTWERRKSASYDRARVCYSSSGRMLAIAWADDEIELWDSKKRKLVKTLRYESTVFRFHSLFTPWIVFSSDEKDLFSWGNQLQISRWNIANGNRTDSCIKIYNFGSPKSQQVTVSPNRKWMAVSFGYDARQVRLYCLESGIERHLANTHRGALNGLAFSSDGSLVYGSSEDDEIVRIWEIERRAQVDQLSFNKKYRYPAIISGALVGFTEKSIGVMDLHKNAQTHILPAGDLNDTGSVAVSTDRKIVAWESYKHHNIYVWETSTGNLLKKIHNKKLEGVAYPIGLSRKGRLIATFEENRAIRVWDLAAERVLQEWKYKKGIPRALAITPDNRSLIVGDSDGYIAAFDIAKGQLLYKRSLLAGEVTSLQLSHDGRQFAVGCENGKAFVIETYTGKPRRKFKCHMAAVTAIAFSPKSDSFATGSKDSTIVLSDLTNRRAGSKKNLSIKRHSELWAALRSAEAELAYQAIWDLALHPDESTEFLAQKLKPVVLPKPERVDKLIANLNSPLFSARAKSMNELQEIGEFVSERLRKALAKPRSLEQFQRIKLLLQKISRPTASVLQMRRAVEVLEMIADSKCIDVLNRLNKGTELSNITRDARQSLSRLKQKRRTR